MAKIIRDDVDRFFDYGIEINTKTLYMGSISTFDDGSESGTDNQMAEYALKGLHILDSKKNDIPITIIMNNIGGDEYHGLAIYDAIKSCQNEVVVKAFGHCMSMGSWIIQAADERLLSHNCTMMLHYGTSSYDGHSQDFLKYGEEVKRMCKLMEDSYLEKIKQKHPNYTRTKLQNLIKNDLWLPAQEAVNLGLADGIIV